MSTTETPTPKVTRERYKGSLDFSDVSMEAEKPVTAPAKDLGQYTTALDLSLKAQADKSGTGYIGITVPTASVGAHKTKFGLAAKAMDKGVSITVLDGGTDEAAKHASRTGMVIPQGSSRIVIIARPRKNTGPRKKDTVTVANSGEAPAMPGVRIVKDGEVVSKPVETVATNVATAPVKGRGLKMGGGR